VFKLLMWSEGSLSLCERAVPRMTGRLTGLTLRMRLLNRVGFKAGLSVEMLGN
jgi:hypothetical protein